MTTLKISDRDAVITQALNDAFKPRFEYLINWMRDELRANLKVEHPVFLKLAKSPESSKYLATGNVRKFYAKGKNDVDKFTLYAPKYGKCVSMPDSHRWIDSIDCEGVGDYDTTVPAAINKFEITDESLIKDYRCAWADYTAACTELKALLNSYTTHERLVKDFPEYAKYLPAPIAKVNLPTVIVKDVRAKLSKLGVPSKK